MISLPVAAVSGLVASAIVIDEAGPDSFGYVMLISTLFMLLPFAELGVQAPVTSGVAESTEPPADPHLIRLLVSCLRILVVSALSIATIVSVLGSVGLLGPLLGIPVGKFTQANLVIALSVSIFAVGLPFGLGQAVLLGLGRYEVAVLLSVITPTSALLVCLLLKYLGSAPLWYAIAQPTGLSICAVITSCVAVRLGRFDWRLLLSRVPASRSFAGLPVRATAGPAFVLMIALPIILQSDRTIISHQGTAAQLAVYGLAAQLYAPLWTIVYTAGQPLWPQFSRSRVDGTDTWSIWLRATQLLILLTVPLGAALILLGPKISDLVSGGGLEVSTWVFAAFCVLLLTQAAHHPASVCLTNPRGLRFLAAWMIVAAVVKLSVAWTITSQVGPAGPIVGSVVAILLAQFLPGLWAMRRRLAG
jgi:O-antigen/teichoic acid export membrane protein